MQVDPSPRFHLHLKVADAGAGDLRLGDDRGDSILTNHDDYAVSSISPPVMMQRSAVLYWAVNNSSMSCLEYEIHEHMSWTKFSTMTRSHRESGAT